MQEQRQAGDERNERPGQRDEQNPIADSELALAVARERPDRRAGDDRDRRGTCESRQGVVVAEEDGSEERHQHSCAKHRHHGREQVYEREHALGDAATPRNRERRLVARIWEMWHVYALAVLTPVIDQRRWLHPV